MMALERRPGTNGQTYVVSTACPRCDEPIAEQESLADHLRHGCPEVAQ